MRARIVSLHLPRLALVVATANAIGLLTAGCSQDLERREFGDAWVPPEDTLGNVGANADAEDDEDVGGASGDGDDPVGDGPAVGEDGGGMPDPDDGGADDSGADDGVDDGTGDDGVGDDPPSADDGGPMESPYVGGWDIGDCQDATQSTGTAVGDVLPDFTLLDQHGDMVRLYDFCHKAVWLIEGAFW